MTRSRVALLAAALLAGGAFPATAGSQSSNSSSNCSNGNCSRLERYSEEDRGWHWGHTRVERWRERQAPPRPPWARGEHAWPAPPWAWEPRPRWRDRRGGDDD
jgi:hypothetical protein